MKLEEIKSAIEELSADDSATFMTEYLSAERVKSFMDTDAGQKIMQPYFDKRVTSSIETWKGNNLQALIDAEVKKRFPEADPKDVKLANMQAELDKVKAEAARKEQLIKAQSIATKKGLPVEIIGYFIGEDDKATEKNIDTLADAFNSAISATVDERLKQGNHVPPADKKKPLDGVTAAFLDRNPDLQLND